MPRPTIAEQSAIHDTAEYFDHPYFEQRRADQLTTLRRCRGVFERIRAVLGCVRGISVLDVGCDTGAFLACAMQEYGIVPFGVDVSSRAVQEARQKGFTVYHGTMEAIPPKQRFRIVTITDVIEHVPDPGLLLQQVHERLEVGGIVYIQTPNFRSTIYQLGRMLSRLKWRRLDGLVSRLFPRQHIQYFSEAGFVTLVKEKGFDIVTLLYRPLAAAELEVSPVLLLPLMALQLCDILLRRQILLCALLKKPDEVRIANC